VEFIPDLDLIGLPKSRYEGRLGGKGTLGKKHISARVMILSIKCTTQFFETPLWWNRILRNT
jgi:hypothetical protein